MIFVIKQQKTHTVYPEQRTAHFEDAAKITVDSASVLPQGKGNGSEKYHNCWVNHYNKNDVNIITKENSKKAI